MEFEEHEVTADLDMETGGGGEGQDTDHSEDEAVSKKASRPAKEAAATPVKKNQIRDKAARNAEDGGKSDEEENGEGESDPFKGSL